MPKYDSNPDASEIKKFAKAQEDIWRAQKDLDSLQLDFILNVRQMALASTGNNDGKPLKVASGILGYIVREDSALLAADPEIHVNVPEDDPDQRQFANFVLEPWLQGVWRESQKGGRVFTRLPFDLRAIGRAWSYISAVPGLMVTSEYKQLVKDLQSASGADEIARLKKEIAKMKRGQFPIRWKKLDTRVTWGVHDTDIVLPQTVELGKMTRSQIEASDWADQVPDNYFGNATGKTEIEYAHYHNHFVSKLVLLGGSGSGGSNGDPLKVVEFEHGLEMSPCLLTEADLLPDNDKGWRWAGAGFLAMDTINAFDQVMSDMANLHHEWSYSPLIMTHDNEEYEEDAKIGGRPKPLEYGPGKQIDIWKSEKVERGPVPEIGNNSMQLLQELKQLIQQNQYSPVEQGQFKAGTSNNLGTTSVQVAEREFNPSIQALEDTGENACVLFARAYNAINKDFPDYPDTLDVFTGLGTAKSKKTGIVGIPSPDKLEGWEPTFQCIMGRAIPQDGIIQTNIATAKVSLGVSKRQVLEEDLGYENSQRVLDEGWDERMDESLETQDQQAVLALSGQMWASLTPQQQQDNQQLAASTTPSISQAISQVTTPGQGQNNGQQNANFSRTGSAQAPQQPQQQVIPGG